MTRITKIGAGFGALALAAVTLTACGSDKASEPFKDAPRASTNRDAATVIEMPDGFSNLATKCVDGVRYTVVFKNDEKYGSVSTVLDPSCK